MKKILAISLAACMVILSICACSKNGNQTTAAATEAQTTAAVETTEAAPVTTDKHGDFVVGTTYSHLYTYTAGSNESDNYCRRLVYDQLFYVDDLTGEMTSDILENWEWTDEHTLSLTLRDDVYFSDGTQMTVKDILATLQAYIKNANAETTNFERIDYDKTTTDGDFIVNLYYPEVNGGAISVLIIPILSAAFMETHPDGDDAWWTAPVGSGPYTIGDVKMNSSVEYVLRSDYWNKDADFKADSITVKYYTDKTAEYADFVSGNIDLILELDETQYTQLEGDAKYTVRTQSADDVLLFCFNNSKVPAAVREAVAYGVDWDQVAQACYGKLYIPATSHFASTFDCYEDHSADIYQYDPERAQKVLDDAGIDAATITLTMPYFVAGVDGSLIEVVQAYLSPFGITVVPDPCDIPVLIPKLIGGEGEIATQSTASNGNAPKEANTVVEPMEKDQFAIFAIPDDEYNNLCAQGLQETDSEKRAEVYKKIDQWLFDNYQALPVAERTVSFAFNADKIADFHIASVQRGSLAFVQFK